MGDHDNPATCLSAFEHGSGVRNVVLHYFGCLRESGRAEFFATLPPHKQQRIRNEENRIRQQRALFEKEDETKSLVETLKTSHAEFFTSLRPEAQKRIREEEDRIEKIRSILEAGLDGAPNSLENANKPFSRQSASSLEDGSNVTKPSKENGFGFHAYTMFFRNSTPYNDSSCSDKFPNQKVAIKDLLYNKEKSVNPLMRDCKEDEIRWFHFPGNNMEWIEEAIARHYNEERPQYDGLFRRPEIPSKTYMMLRPEYWRGLQHGGRHDAVHARHMRPRCDIISTDPHHLDDSPTNLVLFMPYLHWDTDRKRAKFDEIMRTITEQRRRKEARKWAKLHSMSTLTPMNGPQIHSSADATQQANGNSMDARPSNFRLISTTTEAIDAKVRDEVTNHPNSKFSQTKVAEKLTAGPTAAATPLGRFLLFAALLFEAMDNYQEEQLLKECLHNDPPFHPRRTLDQSFYWTLKTTKKRDRDQVVYRGTAPKKEGWHCGNHTAIDGLPCEICNNYPRMIPRVIMVDQLWLWILEGNTIITSFPKRYGRNKPDPSAVHKSIRLRLKLARKGEINSAADLALIIIDQCSRVFFDRTKTADRQPQVMNIFANAIGNVTNRQTTAAEHTWDIIFQLSKPYRVNDFVDDAQDKAQALLDINTEGSLLREIKDILDELNMMIDIKHQQQQVFKQFQKHLNYMIAPTLGLTGDSDLEDDRVMHLKQRKYYRDKVRRDSKRTLSVAVDLFASLNDQVADLSNLKEIASHTEKALDSLLAMKQQQASIVQARKAVQQTDETLRQGRSIMLFTVITIIFLPLSFGASLFGMNTAELNAGLWTFRREANLIFPISVALIIVSFVLAFSSFARQFLTFMRVILYLIFDLTWTGFITHTGIYNLWNRFKIDSARLDQRRLEIVREWKQNARSEEQGRRDEARRKADAKEAKKAAAKLAAAKVKAKKDSNV